MASWGTGLALWARLQAQSLPEIFPSPAALAGWFFSPHPWSLAPVRKARTRREAAQTNLYASARPKKPGPLDRICNSTEYDVQRRYQSNSTHASTSSDPRAVARKILAAEIPFRPRTRRESAARCWKAARHGRTGPASGRRLDGALGASSAAHLPGRLRVGSAPRADRFSDSVRPRSAPG